MSVWLDNGKMYFKCSKTSFKIWFELEIIFLSLKSVPQLTYSLLLTDKISALVVAGHDLPALVSTVSVISET